MPWERPADVPIGQVWSRFKGRERDGKPARLYQIRDMEEKDQKKCLDMMQETFLRDEPLCQVLDVNSDPTSILTIRDNWESIVAQKMSLACYTEVDGQPEELVGFNILFVKSRDDEEEDIDLVQGESWKKLLRTLIAAEQLVDVFDHYGVDRCLSASGLTVTTEHRGQNIGARLIAAREPLCKATRIDAVSTVFTAKTSQVLATKCGYELLATLPYKDVLDGVEFSGCDVAYAEYRGRRFHFSKGA